MIAARSSKQIAAWSSYWSEGNITSLPNLFADNYSGDVLRFWDEAFATLEEDGRVLEICAGNGAIAYLARDHADRRGIRIEIHAIDVAEIQLCSRQGDDSTINDVQFHSGVAVEASHCRNDYFDLIAGQFAIEYCSIPEAVEELSRIIRKNGSLILMVHHADSATAQRTRHFVDVADIFLKAPTIFYRLRKYAKPHIGRKRIDARKAPQKRQQLMGLRRLSRAVPDVPFEVFAYLAKSIDGVVLVAGPPVR